MERRTRWKSSDVVLSCCIFLMEIPLPAQSSLTWVELLMGFSSTVLVIDIDNSRPIVFALSVIRPTSKMHALASSMP